MHDSHRAALDYARLVAVRGARVQLRNSLTKALENLPKCPGATCPVPELTVEASAPVVTVGARMKLANGRIRTPVRAEIDWVLRFRCKA